MDLDTLLNDISEDAPSGDNLEYDPEFTDLALAAEVKGEQQIGDEVIEAQPPDFADVKEKALALLTRAHDLRVAMNLAMAELSTTGFAGFALATTYIRRCLEDRWDTCHPQLDADDDNDPTERVNAVRDLVHPDGHIFRALRRAPLTESRAFGEIGFREIEFATGMRDRPENMDGVADATTISAAFQDTDSDVLAEKHGTIGTIRENVDAIDAVFNQMIPGQGPDFQPLKDLLSQMHTKLGEYAGGGVVDMAADENGGGDTPQAAASGGGGQSFSGQVNSPDDVTKALDQILAYYARSEPSSPLPILLDRAKRLVRADFLTIMKDIAPEGVSNVRVVGGLPEESDY